MHAEPIGAGKSSFELIDASRLFDEIVLKKDSILLDLACGSGHYAIAASEIIGNEGFIYALDLWKEGIDTLQNIIFSKNIKNIQARVVDVSKQIPIEKNCVDVCLMATVLHDLIQDNTDDGTLKEIKRVLKPDGTLAIIEFKKIDGPPGPPIQIRLSPEELEKIVFSYGFIKQRIIEIGPFNYLAIFIGHESL